MKVNDILQVALLPYLLIIWEVIVLEVSKKDLGHYDHVDTVWLPLMSTGCRYAL